MPDDYQEKTWEKLQKAVVAIQTSKSIEYSLEELYQAVENMCSHKMDSQLYTKLTALTESHVKSNIKTFFSDTNDKLVCFISNQLRRLRLLEMDARKTLTSFVC